MRQLLLILALFAAGCAKKPVYAVYSKGPPRQVEVKKTATEPAPTFRASLDGDRIRLFALQESDIALTRTVVRSTYAIERRGVAALEWLESLAAPLILIGGFPLFGMSVEFEQGPETRRGWVPNPLLSIIDPRRTLLGHNYASRVLDRDLFPDRPVERRYRVAVPLPAAKVHYRVLAIDRRVLAEGDAIATTFGEIELNGVPDTAVAVAVEVEHGGATYLTLLERPEGAGVPRR